MNLEELLKSDNVNVRVSVDNKWLVWYGEEWVVFSHSYGAKLNDVLYRGQSLERAIVEILE